MRIIPNQVFLDEEDRYEEGVEYDLPLEKALYFVKCGWADASEAVADDNPNEVTLDIHNSTIGMKDSNG